MKQINFVVRGDPVAKGRAKARHVPQVGGKGFTMMYTPKKTSSYEEMVRNQYCVAHPGAPVHDGPVRLIVVAYYQPPKSMAKGLLKKIAESDRSVPVLKKPDWDNLGKIVSDSLNTIAYRDDSLIFDGRCLKFYSNTPRIFVSLQLFDHGEDLSA